MAHHVPDGDHLPRAVCPNCGEVHYVNPKVIVGCVAEWTDGRILMCRRNIEPRLGYWTVPAGFMELHETSGQGAARETLEEAQAEVEIGGLLAVIDIPYVSQIYIVHRGRLKSPHHGRTPESSETMLMRESEIPWKEIAFPTIYHSLKFYFEDRKRGVEGFHSMAITSRAAAYADVRDALV